MLKLDYKRLADGTFEDMLITAPGGQQLKVRFTGINPDKIRTEIDGPREIQVSRASRGGTENA
jgi:hypothetical protein